MLEISGVRGRSHICGVQKESPIKNSYPGNKSPLSSELRKWRCTKAIIQPLFLGSESSQRVLTRCSFNMHFIVDCWKDILLNNREGPFNFCRLWANENNIKGNTMGSAYVDKLSVIKHHLFMKGIWIKRKRADSTSSQLYNPFDSPVSGDFRITGLFPVLLVQGSDQG